MIDHPPLEMQSPDSLSDIGARSASLFSENEWSDLSEPARQAYEDARISGLCHEGALEIALRHASALTHRGADTLSDRTD